MADQRHKRDANARRKPRAAVVAGPLAVLATAAAVTFGVAGTPSAPDLVVSASADEAPEASFSIDRERPQPVSRSASRIEPVPTKAERMLAPAAVRKAIRNADTRLWTTTLLNLWTAPGDKAEEVGDLAARKRVLVTGRSLFGREEVVVGGKARWVTRGYLVAEKPVVEQAEEEEPAAREVAEPQLGGTCTNGSSVSPGVSANVVKVHSAVCAAFPQLTSYGDFRGDGEHSQGIALDIMVSGDLGWQVAEFLRANYADLGISYLIYAQKIWSVERGGEGWRPMEDRGSVTANHYDHVHVTTY